MTEKKIAPEGVGAAYLRVSGDKQDKRSQEEAIDRWLNQHGLVVAHYYHDVGPRDMSHARQDFQRLLKDAAAGAFQWVVVAEADRLGARSPWEFGKHICLLQEAGVELWSVVDGLLSGDDVVSSILGTISSARSQEEQKSKADRAVRAKVSCALRNEWCGGSPPFGMDLAAFTPGSDVELWRVYYETRDRRIRIWPDGRVERYDGKGNFPPRNAGDVLRPVPSRDADRVEWARKIFQWFATEAISIRGLCTRLNDLGVPSVAGDGWYSTKLKPMLMNPIYLTGATTWNKRAGGRHAEYVSGETRPVKRIKGRAVIGRKRTPADYVTAGGTGGIIDPGTWNAVQQKLAGFHKPQNAPRNSSLYLSSLLYCSQCGHRMNGWSNANERHFKLSYCCSQYRLYGSRCPSKCYLHRVRHDVIAALVERWLADAHHTLDAILDAQTEEDLVAELGGDSDPRRLRFLKDVTAIWRALRGAGLAPPPGEPWTCQNMMRAYAGVKDDVLADARAELAERRAELATLTRQLAKAKAEAVIVALTEQMERLGEQIAELEQRTRPLDEIMAASRADLEEAAEKVRLARQAIAGDANRRKTEALQRLLARIVLRFEHFTAGSQKRSRLVEVTFEPLAGNPTTILVTPTAGRPSQDLRLESSRGLN